MSLAKGAMLSSTDEAEEPIKEIASSWTWLENFGVMSWKGIGMVNNAVSICWLLVTFFRLFELKRRPLRPFKSLSCSFRNHRYIQRKT